MNIFVILLFQERQGSSWEERHITSLLLEPRSLVLVREDMYKVHLHGIAERTEDTITDEIANLESTDINIGDVLKRGTRVSLTIRHVPKVLKAKIKLGLSR